MVKLSTARESRAYGPRLALARWEYINAGIYVFATILLSGGFGLQLVPNRAANEVGLVLVLIGLAVVVVVNGHDLIAHFAGIDYMFSLMGFDVQLGLVEFAVPVVQMVGTVLAFIGVLLLFIQTGKGYRYRMEKLALNILIAGPVLWLLGSIHNACQIYERADGHVQILQASVQIPFLLGSLLFLVAGIFNKRDMFRSVQYYTFKILGKKWVWLSLAGSLLFLVGGLTNVMKVFKMQQMDGIRLERLRGGAQEKLNREREGQVPLIFEENRKSRHDTGRPPSAPPPSYKDAVVGSQPEA